MDEELAYLAGFFDGEGCVSIRRSGVSYSLMLEVTQLNPSPLFRYQQRFGGRVYLKRDKRGYRPLHAWNVVASRASRALVEMLPYLDGKVDEARAGIEMQEHMLHPLPDRAEELAIRERLHATCKALKKRTYEDVPWPEMPIPVQDHSGQRLRWAKPKPAPKVRVKAAPVKSEGYRRRVFDDLAISTLRAYYSDHGLAETAREYGVSRQAVLNWLDRYGIPRQGRTTASEARRKAASAASWTSLILSEGT